MQTCARLHSPVGLQPGKQLPVPANEAIELASESVWTFCGGELFVVFGRIGCVAHSLGAVPACHSRFVVLLVCPAELQPLKAKAQTALFKDPVRTAL